MPDVKIEIIVESSKAKGAIGKLSKEQDFLSIKTVKAANASKKQASAIDKSVNRMDKMATSAVKAGLAVAGVATAAAGFNKLLGFIREVDEAFKKLGKKQGSLADSIKGLKAVTKGVPNAVPRAIEAAARAEFPTIREGIDAITFLKSAPSNKGGFKGALKDAAAIALVRNLGADEESAVNIVTLGRESGLTASGAVAKAFQAGTSSAKKLEQIAPAAVAAPEFGGDFGAAVSVAALLSSEQPVQQLRVLAENAGRALFLSNKITDKITKKLKKEGVAFGELDTTERLLAFKRFVPDISKTGLQEAGLTEVRQSKSIELLLRKLDDFVRIRGEVAAAKGGLGERELAIAREDPIIKSADLAAASRVAIEANFLLGPLAGKVRKEQARDAVESIDIAQKTGPAAAVLIDADTFEKSDRGNLVTTVFRILDDILSGGIPLAPFAPGVPGQSSVITEDIQRRLEPGVAETEAFFTKELQGSIDDLNETNKKLVGVIQRATGDGLPLTDNALTVGAP